MKIKNLTSPEENSKILNRCVVRLKSGYYQKGSGYYYSKGLSVLKRKSSGYNLLEEGASNFGIEEIMPRILNLHDSPDGVYELITSNISYDWESGYPDDYDFELVKFEEEVN